MPDWTNNPQASYVLAAYGLAVVVLLGLLVASWRGWRVQQAAWYKINPRRHGDS